jgi:hypothetical protein
MDRLVHIAMIENRKYLVVQHQKLLEDQNLRRSNCRFDMY